MRALVLGVCLASFGVLAVLGIGYLRDLERSRNAATTEEEEKAKNVEQRIDAALAELPVHARRLAAKLAELDFDDESVSKQEQAARLEAAFARAIEEELGHDSEGRVAPSQLFQFGLGLAPQQHPTDPLFLEYARRRQDGGRSSCEQLSNPETGTTCEELSRDFCLFRERVKPDSDYSATRSSEYQWYWKARDQGPGWVEPYFDPFTRANLTEFSVPITKNGKFLGVVYANYSTLEMHQLVTEEDLGGTGYTAVVSAKGVIVAHPVNDYVTTQRKLGDVDPKLWGIVSPALAGKPVSSRDYSDPTTGAGSTVLAHALGAAVGGDGEAVPGQRYALALLVVFDSDRGVNLVEERWTLITLIDAAVIFAIASILVLLLRQRVPSKTELWSASALISLLLFGGMVAIWALTGVHSTVPGAERPPLVSRGRLNDEVSVACQGARAEVRQDDCRVPTGLFLQSVQFTDADTVNVTGYVWQRYSSDLPPPPDEEEDSSPPTAEAVVAEAEPPSLPASEHSKSCSLKTLRRGFLLPEAVEMEKKLAYRREENGTVVLGWNFRAALRETFTYSTYPLDTKDVWVRLWDKDFSKNVILVPDLDAYTDVRPSAKPGVERRLVHTGWTVQHSFFNYACGTYNTNFGLPDYVGQADFPELHFHLVLRRTFFSAFVKNLVPLLVAAIILFSVLLLVTRQRELTSRYGANTAGTMAACSGLFFTVLLAHIQLRSDFPVDGVLYLEWFNFAMYAMILAVAVNAYLFSWDRPFPWISYRDNLISKLLYWPTLLSVLLVATTVSFLNLRSGTVYPGAIDSIAHARSKQTNGPVPAAPRTD